jgi:type II secretory pathway pseudopilin PulG
MKRNRTQPRGYLLIETMVSGAIIALVLAGSLSVIASERAAVSQATMRARASSLAEETLSQLIAENNEPGTPTFTCQTCGSPPCTPTTWNATTVNVGDYPGFVREYACLEFANSGSGRLGDMWQVGVRVTFPSDKNDATAGTDTIEHWALRRSRLLPTDAT